MGKEVVGSNPSKQKDGYEGTGRTHRYLQRIRYLCRRL